MICLLSLASCFYSSSFFNTRIYDTRALHISTLCLFNQLDKTKEQLTEWAGDWVFRRERLALIDSNLQQGRPDILLLQEALEKGESDFDADRSILRAGALSGYDWQELEVAQNIDNEREFLAIASAVPLVIRDANRKKLKLLKFGEDGFVGVFSVSLEREELILFNVQSPKSTSQSFEAVESWFSFLQHEMHTTLEGAGVCKERVIVGGHINADIDSAPYQAWLRDFGLVDSSTGFCDDEEECFTATSANETYLRIAGEGYHERADRLLVHKSAHVMESAREFAKPAVLQADVLFHGQKKLWASKRFGWGASIRFARCN